LGFMTEPLQPPDTNRPGGAELRLAETRDVAAVGDVSVRAYADGGFISEHDDYAVKLRDAQSRLEGAELWVATVGGTVRGTVTFCPPGSVYRELAGPDEGEFRMLAVDPAARRQGLARALAQRCVDRCVELGLDELVLCSLPENAAAHALYTSMGFSRDTGLDWQPAPGVWLLGFRAPVASSG
jgi:ribosomal protein S18 acetylase RimI-like enzyme